ncbi:MAG: hypothetical protein DCC56_08645 [Anaerolineae bacterium]|nr:MAG: hypothetical protein DCC56_08645 [Anaerolineae bacterium]WKZ45342.1 MAG: SUMF1/EgtB/PvdO family nonheme iron enzyme [Anaerolineales bacterium]
MTVSLTSSSVFDILGILLFIVGVFLLAVGFNVVQVDKKKKGVGVSGGQRTTIFGLLLLFVGIVFLFFVPQQRDDRPDSVSTSTLSSAVNNGSPNFAPEPFPTNSPSVTALIGDSTATITLTPPITNESPTIPVNELRISPIDGMTLLFVPAGEFIMGSLISNADADEFPKHIVYLHPYYIDQTEVTNAMFQLCIDARVCKVPTMTHLLQDPRFANHPVVFVSWSDADTYCKWAGRMLPTEAQWEKAARGIDGRTYPWGDGIDVSFANYGGYADSITAVGSYPKGASTYGAMDMVGNVWEWVFDWYDPNYYQKSRYENPPGPETGDNRVFRGGSWASESYKVRSSYRSHREPNYFDENLGFRCALPGP